MGKSWGENPQGLDFLFSPQFPYSIGEFNRVNEKDGLPPWFSTKGNIPSRGYLAMSGAIFHSHNWEVGWYLPSEHMTETHCPKWRMVSSGSQIELQALKQASF